MNHGICKGCGKPIVWIRTSGGKSMPCDAQEVAYKAVKGAKGKVVTPNGEVLSCVFDGAPEEMTGIGYVPHWSTCQQATRFRKGSGGRIMKVLVACEESQEVCKAFRALGHEAYSCDIEPCSGGHSEWHLQCDALEMLKLRWDLIIAHPPCTDLAVSGAKWFAEKRADGRQQAAIDFFMRFINADCEHIAVENPVSIMSTQYRKPDQIIQPWMFGHPEKKATCLWLKGLPALVPTNDVSGYMQTLPKNQQERLHYLPPSHDRAKLRSKTFPGIARAMAEQWGGICQPEGEDDT